MAAQEPQEPRPPEPAAFDLTKERIAEFESAQTWFTVRVRRAIFVLAFVVALACSLYLSPELRVRLTVSPVPTLLALLIWSLGLAFLVAFLIGGLDVGRTVSALWKRRQPDYARVEKYKVAVGQYHAEHAAYEVERAAWLKTQRSWWDALGPKRFEQEIAEFFQKEGHRVQWTGRSGDGGVDVRLTTQDGRKIVVQCKAHGKPVSPGAVRDLYGTLLHVKADEAWLMSRSGFTAGATRFAVGKPIRLLTLDHIVPGLTSLPSG